MWTGFLVKILPYALVLSVGVTAGMVLDQKLNPPPAVPACPACSCPEPTVKAQTFEVEKMKGLKNFVYSPQFSGSISVAGVDSTALRRMIDRSMDESFKKYGKRSRR